MKISGVKNDLIEYGDKLENRQECNLLYILRLGEMRHCFSVFIGSLVRYGLFDVREIDIVQLNDTYRFETQ